MVLLVVLVVGQMCWAFENGLSSRALRKSMAGKNIGGMSGRELADKRLAGLGGQRALAHNSRDRMRLNIVGEVGVNGISEVRRVA